VVIEWTAMVDSFSTLGFARGGRTARAGGES
jgi:hypothetical protein